MLGGADGMAEQGDRTLESDDLDPAWSSDVVSLGWQPAGWAT